MRNLRRSDTCSTYLFVVVAGQVIKEWEENYEETRKCMFHPLIYFKTSNPPKLTIIMSIMKIKSFTITKMVI